MKIKSALLRAAQVVHPKQDVRPHFNGIHITRKYVEATNGHVALRMEHSTRVRHAMIINISGKVPAKAQLTQFVFGKDGEYHGLAKHYGYHGELMQVHPFTVIDGVFPDLDRPNLFGDPDRYKEGNAMPAMSGDYLALPKRLFQKEKLVCAKPMPGPTVNDAVMFHFGGLINDIYGNPKLIVMPMRWD